MEIYRSYNERDRRWEFRNEKGQLHNEFGPAIEYQNGNCYYVLCGYFCFTKGEWEKEVAKLRSKENKKPAKEEINMSSEFTEYNVRVYKDYTEWYNKEGYLHREGDLPAKEWKDGAKSWWKKGLRHREDGHAIEYADGNKEYWLNNQYYSKEEWEAEVAKLKAPKIPQEVLNAWKLLESNGYKIIKES